MNQVKYNKTQLNPDTTFERHVFHRDQFAHYLRWTHVLKVAKIGMNVLDWGCGNGNLAEVLYRNRYKAKKYLGLDIRKKTIEIVKEKFKKVDWIDFKCKDLVEHLDIEKDIGNDWDMICCFEVLEHVGKENAIKMIDNIAKACNQDTMLLLSTPVHDPKVGAAKNHIINGEIGEFGFEELKNILKKLFIVEDVFGTFASQKDYKSHMNEWQKEMFLCLKKYYDTNLVSNLMAPFFPKYSRNCLWRLKLKNE